MSTIAMSDEDPMSNFGKLLRVYMNWNGMYIELVACWRRQFKAQPLNPSYKPCSLWRVHSHEVEFTMADDLSDLRPDRILNPNRPEDDEHQAPVYLIRDHPDDKDMPLTQLRALSFSSAQPAHASGLPVWKEDGDNGRFFLFHPGYNMLIPIGEWEEWLKTWDTFYFDYEY